MMTPQPITFEHREIDGVRQVFAKHEWPECVLISPVALRGGGIAIDDDGMIVITVANGYAAYKLAPEQTDDYAVTCVLSDGGFSPPPPSDNGE